MILVDSSGWLEYLRKGPQYEIFARVIDGSETLLLSTIQIYEIYKILKREETEEEALGLVVSLKKCRFVPVDETLSLEAADIALEHKLSMADAIIYATAKHYKARLLTKDSDFKNLSGVEVIQETK